MTALQKRFGKLLGIHRRASDLTQASLAEKVGMSVDMIKKLEIGVVGPSFRTIEALAVALDIDPAELFTSQLAGGRLQRADLRTLTDELSSLSDQDLAWVSDLVHTALHRRRP